VSTKRKHHKQGGNGVSEETNNATDTDNPDRKEYMAQYYAENKAEIAARRKAKRLAQREEITAAERERYATDPAAREQRLKTNAKGRKTYKERIATDPEAHSNTKNVLPKGVNATRRVLLQTPNTANNEKNLPPHYVKNARNRKKRGTSRKLTVPLSLRFLIAVVTYIPPQTPCIRALKRRNAFVS